MTDQVSPQKVAIVHHWLVGMRGGEKVLEAFCELYPEADIYTHVYDENSVSDLINSHKIFTTFINKLPLVKKLYQAYLPLMPLALEQINLGEYNLVISIESGPSKGVIVRPGARHICYCNSPMRYIWDMYHDYLKESSLLKRLFFPIIAHYLRIWDRSSADGVDLFVANSKFISDRIKRYYRRDSIIINPPVEVNSFFLCDSVGDYYLLFGQLVSYKRPDLAIEAFNKSGKKLIVIGDGPLESDLKKIASSNIKFLGRLPDDKIRKYLSECKALIFPGLEDFGIVPVEVMASGRPVLAFGAGGILDTVIDGVTGIFFSDQTIESLNNAVEKFESNTDSFNSIRIIEHANKFSKHEFQRNFIEAVRNVVL